MRYFNPIDREFVEPIPLNMLQQQAQYLTQKDEANVAYANKIYEELMKMDFNEDEAGWVADKANEINDIIKQNSVDGLASFATKALIKGRSDILFGPDTNGRLKRQKDWKAFQAKIDSMDIPENYKANFKELNPYGVYQDRYDKNGNIIEGEAWKPNKTPVKSIDRQKLYASALAIASKEKGGGNIVTFLDANGKETTDINKSVDDIWYAKNGYQYERLPENKIKQAINNAISNTPGAEESFRQDYEMAVYDYNKNRQPIAVPGLTDDKGNLYDYNQYKQYSINQFAGVAAYNHGFSDITFNPTSQKSAVSRGANNSNNGIGDGSFTSYVQDAILAGGQHRGLINTNVDSYALTAQNKNAANNDFISTIKDKRFKDVSGFISYVKANNPNTKINGPVGAVMEYLKIHGNKYSPQEKAKLINSSRNYVTSNMRMQELEKGLDKKDVERLRFNNSLSSGEFKVGNSRWDNNIIKGLNDLWSNNADENGNINIEVPIDLIEPLVRSYNKQSINELDFINYTINDDSYILSINSKDRNNTPEFASNLIKVNNESTSVWNPANWYTGLNAGRKRYRFTVFGNKNYTMRDNFGANGYGNTTVLFAGLGKQYDEGVKQAAKVQENLQVTGILEPIVSTKYGSYTDIGIDYDLKSGRIDSPEAKRLKDMSDERLKGFFSGPGVEIGYLYTYDGEKAKFTNENAKDAATLLRAAYASGKNVIRQATPLDNLKNPNGRPFSSPNGYAFDIYIDKDLAKATNFKEGQTVSLLYAGNCDEGTGYDYGSSIDVMTKNALANTKRSGLGSPIIISNQFTGNTEVQYNKNNGLYNCNFAGKAKEVNYDSAKAYTKALYMLQQLNATVKAIAPGNPEAGLEYILNNPSAAASMEQIVNTIMICTGASQALAISSVTDYIRYGE